MKNQTQTNHFTCSRLALILALAIWVPVSAQSAEPSPGKIIAEGKMMADVKMTEDGKMMDRCQAVMDQKEKILAEMKAQDAELGEQGAKLNSAPEEKKVILMAAILTRLVEQRTAMNEQLAKMGDEMMKHMMQHMEQGNGTMPACLMMKGMDKKPAETVKVQPTDPK